MRGDERQLNSPGEDSGTRGGPRHAAPRKSLLTKLHIPAGKAFALAAMPTAVFVGMGLTPKLALADDSSDIPFAPGPCVTRSDEPSEEPSPSASKPASPSPSATDSGDKGASATPKPSATPSASESVKPEAKTKAAEADAPAATPSASPTPTKTRNPLDPLGVGDALRDLFDGPDKETASPSPSASTASPKPSATDTAEKPAKKPVEKATDAAKETADKTAAAIREAAGQAGKSVKELDDSVKGLDAKKDEDIPDGAKERFPCPTADPKALAAADLETGIPLLPTDPWILESSMLTLNGLDYKGIVEVKTYDGKVKKALKFTASSIDIDNLHQKTVGPAGTTTHVEARKGSKSTIRNGTVTMYTEELKGNLFGLIPVTFSPETPPPLNVPFAFFTKVKVTQAGQFGGSLKVPGLHNYFTGGNS
ncbi:hypothetical protein OG887_28500 [Streptomyces sp. NBC_00053]|uniref:hypothetical protein n=1 Tax=unclassified Streptomyces TaxID=2593676 RepID=UPI00224F1F07|nr:MULTISPECIES: hypothetical protein [unclassified Streptomyces]MCX5105794.1 hypothetical protein [Streptomyces sp. NBC_00439]MCX5503283.1 hypothetical protein [Streptomyces sp. NBC_00052]MCX5548182.1 hypothetical protein [Streptomyces sp. NBC_00051]